MPEYVVINLASTEELLNKAFHLAGFILGDREAAVRVVTRALLKLEVTATAQGKRLYYRPLGRGSSGRPQADRFRNIVSFNELHLLQRLIYLESEPFEIAQEQGKALAPASEEDLVVHFIKYLVGTTIRRNSFYVALGLSRLLYSYSTAETMDIYYAVIQDPERVKDDYYYRSRKGILMQELKERFGNLIKICRGSRGEEKFEVADNQMRFGDLVRKSLALFTPWHTPCLVPAGVNPISDGISSLAYKGPQQEDQTEVNRMHAVVHPDCFETLISELHFDPPDSRLAIPRFLYAGDKNNKEPGNNRHDPAKLNEEELISIKGELDNNASRRKSAHSGVLRIMVDGIEKGHIDLGSTSRTRFNLQKGAELIEVRARDKSGEELLLAAHLLTYADNDNQAQLVDASIILEGEQEISIMVSPALSEDHSVVEVSYRETNPLRATRLLLTQLKRSKRSLLSRSTWNDHPILVPIVALILIAVCFGVALKYASSGNRRESAQNEVITTQKAVQPEDKPPSTGGATDNSNSSTRGEIATGKVSRTDSHERAPITKQTGERLSPLARTENPTNSALKENAGVSSRTGRAESEIETRSTASVPAAVPLSAVRKVYVETAEEVTVGESLREILVKRLGAGNRIALAHNRDEADALLKLTIAKGSEPQKTIVVVKLINPRGEVIWPSPGSAGSYQGTVEDVSARIVRDLLSAIKKSDQRR